MGSSGAAEVFKRRGIRLQDQRQRRRRRRSYFLYSNALKSERRACDRTRRFMTDDRSLRRRLSETHVACTYAEYAADRAQSEEGGARGENAL